MANFYRFFLVFEGKKNSYPNFSNSCIHLTDCDPATLGLDNPFVFSPLFSFPKDGVESLPKVEGKTKISFIMIPSIYPSFIEIEKQFTFTNEVWFTMGLANLVVIEEDTGSLANNIIEFLKKTGNVSAYETLYFDDCTLSNHQSEHQLINPASFPYEKIKIELSEELPLYLQFSVSEYIISIQKFLSASYKFTPQYYKLHNATIKRTLDMIDDISFLSGDYRFEPTTSVLRQLDAPSKQEAIEKLNSNNCNVLKDALINERHGMIVQFNSSMSYIYSQAYSGTFPILDHYGIIRRHSLLGIGTAINALFELIIQLEEALYSSPFENLKLTAYENAKVPDAKWYDCFIEPSYFQISNWENNPVKNSIVASGREIDKNDEFYYRLAFFSGRLGFREYEFSATAAIQVLVESHKLRWNVINYTHEIIHNHVRNILIYLIPPKSVRENIAFTDWITHQTDLVKRIIDDKDSGLSTNYREYFILILIKFVINSNFYGSLTMPSDLDAHAALVNDPQKKITLILHTAANLKSDIQHLYKDITEIFVHILDFVYIYNRKTESYLLSIWLSWSTIPAVSSDIRQYILRSLLIISTKFEDGILCDRFEQATAELTKCMLKIHSEKLNPALSERVNAILKDEAVMKDLQLRFYNCIIVSDMVNQFFVTDLEKKLDNDDGNRLSRDSRDENGSLISYAIPTDSFEGKEIKSKVRFLLDQLEREISQVNKPVSQAQTERTSAWLLLSLSSNIKHD